MITMRVCIFNLAVFCVLIIGPWTGTALSQTVNNIAPSESQIDFSKSDIVVNKATIFRNKPTIFNKDDGIVNHAIYFDFGSIVFVRSDRGFDPEVMGKNDFHSQVQSIYGTKSKIIEDYQLTKSKHGKLAYMIIHDNALDGLCFEFIVLNGRLFNATKNLLMGVFCSISETPEDLKQRALRQLDLIELKS